VEASLPVVLFTLGAAPVINSFLSTAIGGYIGNRADALLCNAYTSSKSFFQNLRTQDPALNHDLERATREAYLLATAELLRQAELRTQVSGNATTFLNAADPATLAALRRGLEADLKNLANTLPNPIRDVHLFLLDPQTAPEERLKTLRQSLEANLLEDFARWAPGQTVPAAVPTLLQDGWTLSTQHHQNIPRDWLNLIAIAFIEKLKSTPRLAAVFQAKLLAQISAQEPSTAPIANFTSFATEFDKIAIPLQRIERSLEQIEAGLADIKDSQKRIEDALASQRAFDIATERRLFERREQLYIEELDRKAAELKLLDQNLFQTKAHFDALAAERAELINTLAQRDRSFAAEIAEYRKQIAALTKTDNPALQAALQSFADGDRLGAYPVIEHLIRAENTARQRATSVQNAARFRELAALALLMKDRGEKSTNDLIVLWQQAQDLDPTHHWGWVELGLLYKEAGNLTKSRHCAEQALATAEDGRGRSVALTELGALLLQAGDLAGAQHRFAQSLAILEQLAAANPSPAPGWASAQRDVSVCLSHLADAQVQAGDLAGALQGFARSLKIYERLAAADPSCSWVQRDLSLGLNNLGDVQVQAGDLAAAKQRYTQSLIIREQLAAANPSSAPGWAQSQRDLSLGLEKVGDVQVRVGDLAAALQCFSRSLIIREHLAAANPSSALAQRDVAGALQKLGNVQFQAGDLAAAQQRFTQSLKISEQLAADNLAADNLGADNLAAKNPASATRNAQAQRDLSISLSKLGDLLVQAGDLAAAQQRFTQSLKISEQLAATNPASAQAQEDLSVSLDQLGHVLLLGGELAGAQQRFSQSLKIREQLAAANPSSATVNAQAQRALCMSLDGLGNVKFQGGDLAGALHSFTQSFRIREQLAAANPSSATMDAQAQRDLSISLGRLGDLQFQAGDLAAAQQLFARSLKIREQLAAANPSSAIMDAQAQRDLSISLDKLGDLQFQAGDLAAAQQLFTQALKIRERLAAANPSSATIDAQAQRDLSVSLTNLGDVQVQAGDFAGAQQLFAQSLRIRERLVAANPGSAQAQSDVSFNLEKLGDVEVQAGDLAGAQQLFTQALEIREQFAAANPSAASIDAQAQRDLFFNLEKLGDLQVQAGDLAGAQQRFAQALKISEQLAAANPSSNEAQRDLSIILEKLGDLQVQAGDLAGAQQRFVQALKISEQLAAANPSSPTIDAQAQRDLIASLWKLAQHSGDKSYWRRALSLAETLQSQNRLAPTDLWIIEDLRKQAN
jgi:tetratricopeptide (TPR) repeat protein